MSTNPARLSRFTRLALPLLLATAGCVAGTDATDPPTGSGGSGVGPGTGGGNGPSGSGGSGNGSTGGSSGTGGTGGAIVGSGGNGSGGVGTGGGGPVDPNQCEPMATVPRRLWRLSNLQYANSIRDLLKLTGTLPEITGGGTAIGAFFSKDTEQVDDRLAFDYYTASEAAVAQIDPIRLAACMPAEAEQACAQRFITGLATTGFRRPVGAAEVADLMVLYTEGRKKDFATGIRLMVQGVLVAPTFAYRTELGTGTAMPATITPHEVASQLSYLFLNSIPDAPLMTAASNGTLGTPAGVMTQVDRLLASPQGQANISRIVVDWFGGRQTKGKEARFNFSEAMQADAITATRLFVEDVLWKGNKRVEDLLLSNRMFVNPALAPLYGFTVPAGTPATTFVAVSAPAGQRAGILTQPGIAVAKSNTDETSVVHRGLFILKDVLCGITVPDPPAGLLESEAVVKALASFTTERQRADYRLKTPACATCHINIDPYGMMLEHIDPIGRYRTTLPDGGPVAATWNLNLSPSLMGSVTGAVQFAEGLVKDKMFTMCATRKMASYALGIDQPKACELVAIHDKFQANADHSIATLLRDVTMASFMRTRGAQ